MIGVSGEDAKRKRQKPSGGKQVPRQERGQERSSERAKHDAPRPDSKFASKFDSKSENRASSFRKPRPQFAKAASKPSEDKPIAPLREIKPYSGARPGERLPLILETEPSPDYALIDSGNGLKLEQYGPYRIVRPEGQAIWLPSLPQKEWDEADAVFTGNTDEEGMGRWAFQKCRSARHGRCSTKAFPSMAASPRSGMSASFPNRPRIGRSWTGLSAKA